MQPYKFFKLIINKIQKNKSGSLDILNNLQNIDQSYVISFFILSLINLIHKRIFNYLKYNIPLLINIQKYSVFFLKIMV